MHQLQDVSRLWLIFGCIFCSISVSVQVSFRLHFLREPVQQLFLQPGQINQLDCVYDKTLEGPTHSWYRNDSQVDEEYIQDFPNGTLRFKIGEAAATSASQREHFEGKYRCCISDASQTVCSSESTVSFPTLSPAEVIPSRTNGVLGETLRLFCDVQGNPEPGVTWYQDQDLLQADDERVIILPNKVIQISSVVAADAGEYICAAENIAGSVVSQGTLIGVNEHPISSLDARSDILNVTDTDVIGGIGEDVLLECLVRKNSNVEILWTKGTEDVPGGRGVRLGKGNLLIKNASVSDNGTYVCTSIDSNSLITKKLQVRLTIEAPPTFVKVPEDTMEKAEGVTVAFKCTAEGVPMPNVVWYRDGKRLRLGGRYSQKFSTWLWVYNLNPTDTGLYQCFASNHLGGIYLTSFLNVTESVMDLVRNLQGTAIASDSVTLSWTLPNYSTDILIYGCIVYYASIPDGDELSHYIEYKHRSQWNETLGSLRPNANYSISVRVAFDGPGGLSKLSTVYVKTTESVPTAAPEIVNLFSTPTSITVTWKSVDAEHQNGVLTETVACIDQEADNIDASCDEVEQDRTSYTFHNLHPGLEYLVRLAAKTDVGRGPFSDPLPRMTPSKTNCTAPEAVPVKVNIVNSTFVTFSWVEPTHFRSEVITGFRLMIFRGVDGNRIDFVLLDASARSYNKSNAGQSKTYTVTFYAFGLCGEGPSSTSVFKMPEEITVEVDVPINVQAVSKNWSTIDLTWDAPYLPRQSLSYTVQYGVIGGTHSYWTGPATHVNLRNLSPYTIYQMKVKVNISGLYSQLMYCRTLESAPGSPPTRLSGYSLGATSLNLTWYPPAVPNGKITYYTVVYCSSKTISKGWHKIILAVSKDHEGMISLELVNLDSGTAYTIKVSANTSLGAGPSTAPIYAETAVATIYAPSNNFADLRSGILTGVCLALLCITVCVSLLVYHHRHTLCYHNDIQCRSSSTRIGTPTHIRGCRGGGRKGGCPKPSAYQLSILQTEFEMEDLMKRGRQVTAADRLVLQVHHHRETELPVQGANLDAVSSAEEPFLTIHYSEPLQVDTSQDIPHSIPQEDSGDVQSTSTSRQPEVDHHRANARPHRATADVKLDILSEDKRHASYHCLGEGTGEASTSRRSPADRHRRDCHCRERGRRDAELYSSSSLPATTSEKHRASSSASSTHSLALPPNTAAPQGRGQTWQGQGQTWQLREKHLKDHVSSSKSSHGAVGAAEGGSIHVCDQSSDTASLDCDSGLSGDLFGDGNGGCDTSPDFLERVLEELSDNVY